VPSSGIPSAEAAPEGVMDTPRPSSILVFYTQKCYKDSPLNTGRFQTDARIFCGIRGHNNPRCLAVYISVKFLSFFAVFA
jgi:hypothetical protein